MTRSVENYLKNELVEFQKEIEKTSVLLANVMLECGKEEIMINECLKTIKYYKNKKAEVEKLLKL